MHSVLPALRMVHSLSLRSRDSNHSLPLPKAFGAKRGHARSPLTFAQSFRRTFAEALAILDGEAAEVSETPT